MIQATRAGYGCALRWMMLCGARDRIAVSALRSALSAIGNAEAISPPPGMPGAGSPHIAGAVAGLNAAEAQRRTLSAAEVDQIIQADQRAAAGRR